MCAIAGLVGLNWDAAIIDKMLGTMVRRGPDGQGTYSERNCLLLHTRLAVIDPEGGKQPMELTWAGEHYVISYNGELYNTQEIRVELEKLGHSFQTHSDTEVVLHAYAQWGKECLHRFNGIFAFSVWETNKQCLFLARDRMGVKPLFYSLHRDGIVFASEIKTILAYPSIEARLDCEGVYQLLLLGPGRMPGSGVLKNIQELEPGYCGYFASGRLSMKRYWHLHDREHTESFGETTEHVRYLVTDSIRRQMVSDVPIGTFLSGGLDSSVISAISAANLEGKPLDTFSVDYKDNDIFFVPSKFQPNSDGEYIRIMEQALQSNHHWTVLTPENLLENLENATRARDLPGMADVDMSLLAFCGEIRKHVKVALSGECADEIFGGYPWYRDPEVRALQGFPWAQSTDYRAELLHSSLKGSTDPREYIHALYVDTLRQSDILPSTSPLERRMKEMVNLNLRWFMQTLLDRKDRMSMYHGLEVRVPFCDYRIAEYLYGVPWEFKDHRGKEKGLLRTAMTGVLPEKVLWRKKSPYPKTHDPLYLHLVSDRLCDLLQQKDAPVFALVDRTAVSSMLEGESPWPWYGQLMKRPQTITYILQLDYWLREYKISLDL